MALRYQALLTPLKVRGTILRSRMMSSASTPHFLQGTEPYPTEKIITHFAQRAKSGAAAISVNHFHQDNIPFPGRPIDNPPGHFNLFDLQDYTAQNYFCQLLDAIHFYGAKANGYLMADPGWFYPDGKQPVGPDGMAPHAAYAWHGSPGTRVHRDGPCPQRGGRQSSHYANRGHHPGYDGQLHQKCGPGGR